MQNSSDGKRKQPQLIISKYAEKAAIERKNWKLSWALEQNPERKTSLISLKVTKQPQNLVD